MFDFNAARTDLAGKLAAAGLPVALDPRNINPPTVIIGLPQVTGRLSACVLAATVEVTPVAPPPGNADAVERLLDTVATVLATVDWESAAPSSWTLNPTTDLPAYTVTVSVTVTEE